MKRATHKDAAWREQQYNPRAAVPGFQQIFDRWERASADALPTLDGYADVRYGPHPQQTLDVWRARGTAQAALMFIHGGYWRALDKKPFTMLAPALTKAGVTMFNINYALAPHVTLFDLVRQVLQASAWTYRNASNFGAPRERLFVAGHSAGGHLAAMMMAAWWPSFAADLPRKLFHGALTISGVHDLRPLAHCAFLQPEVKLDEASARLLSPVLLPPASDAPLYTCVGGDEPAAFHEQARLIAKSWRDVFAGEIAMPGENHFTVIEKLGDPKSALFQGALKMMGIVPD